MGDLDEYLGIDIPSLFALSNKSKWLKFDYFESC